MTKELDKLGKVTLKPNARARRVIVRYRENAFVATYPAKMKIPEVEKTLERMLPDLLSLKERTPQNHLFTPEAEFRTYPFEVRIIAEGARFYLTLKEKVLYIVCPAQSDFQDTALQNRIREGIEAVLRSEAKRILPAWTKLLAGKHGFEINQVKINKSRSRWGSCSMQKNINLSYFCLLLPEHLIELVILHELCHTRVMNHGEAFWVLLDKVTDGKAQMLTKELDKHHTRF
ncbi:M48 family metallopeptidase [Dysgonomonas sp. 25]|uniref:M48 family metallopeptidase n=1 Tax=Dysgonomonas sp. 25 TaxID=2302933 RepID=UPI0013D3F70A|nr:YgjP-like metallopeptidase domain-containing protein [Dysgonomonas sp. 25]NDV69730.1 DUF45 domain-containing protein [Dysgonomonas sp. 25]